MFLCQTAERFLVPSKKGLTVPLRKSLMTNSFERTVVIFCATKSLISSDFKMIEADFLLPPVILTDFSRDMVIHSGRNKNPNIL